MTPSAMVGERKDLLMCFLSSNKGKKHLLYARLITGTSHLVLLIFFEVNTILFSLLQAMKPIWGG